MTQQDVRALVEEFALQVYQDVLLAQVRPAVYLLCGEPGEPAGASRIGGHPDVPANFEWPMEADEALTFLLQLRLSDLPAFEGNPFPATGLLSVFIGLDEPASDVPHRIYLFPDANALTRREPPTEETASDTFREVAPHALHLQLGQDLPRWATNAHTAISDEMTEDEQNAFDDLIRALEPKNTVGKLLGHAAGIGNDPREDAYVVREVNPNYLYKYDQRAKLDMREAERWQHLLTIESADELDLCIWDAGYLQFLIERNDLKALNFAQVYAAVETS